MFKLLTISSFLLLCLSSLNAQKYVDTYDPEDDKIKSLLGKENDLNGFGAMDLKVGDFVDERALMMGAYGGFIINRRYLFGLAGYGILTNVEFEGSIPGETETKPLNLYGGYGGILIGLTIAPRELIHVSIPIVLGAGSFEISDKDFFVNNPADSEFTVENSAFFIIEPGLELEFNITRYFRIGAGATYRHIAGTELVNVSDEELRGFSGVMSFRFGRF